MAALFLAASNFALVILFVKLASRHFSGLFVSGIRFATGALLCGAVLLFRRGGAGVKNPRWVLLRGLFGAASMVASFAAVSLTGPGRAALLGNTYPLFVALFGALFFKERLEAKSLLSLAVCTAGALLVMRDGSGAALSGDLLALANALLAGMAVNYVRRASAAGDNPFVLYLSPCLLGLPLLAFAPLPASPPPASAVLLLALVGLGSFSAQVLMSIGYRSVPAGRGSVVFYWETALTVLLGFLFGGESPNPRFLLGLCAILAGLWLNGGRPRGAKAAAAGR
jgi:drug/metabolite transporter (DMT)-like permease